MYVKGYKEFVKWSRLIAGDVGDEKILDFAGFIEVEERLENQRNTMRLPNAIVGLS